jgi:hypothetical protein
MTDKAHAKKEKEEEKETKQLEYPICPHCRKEMETVDVRRNVVYEIDEEYDPVSEAWIYIHEEFVCYDEYGLFQVLCPHCSEPLEDLKDFDDISNLFNKK